MLWKRLGAVAASLLILQGCLVYENLGEALLPPMEPNPFATPPYPQGEHAVAETREAILGADGAEAVAMTVFRPVEGGNGAAMVWILGLNHRAYYHQSLHETLASYGYTVVVPDNRPIRFADNDYHSSILRAASAAVDALSDGRLGSSIDPGRIAVGGFSIGGPLAAFVGAERPSVKGLIAWAPVEVPTWMGVDADALLPLTTQPTLVLEGALDTIAPPGVWRARLESFSGISAYDVVPVVLGDAVHFYFQEPKEADGRNPATSITRAEQMGRAIGATLLWLDFTLAADADDS